MTQHAFNFARDEVIAPSPAPRPSEPVIQVRDTHVTHPAKVKRLMRSSLKILARLEEGPATARELMAIAIGYRQRLSDLRAHHYVITCHEDMTTGTSTYTLR